MSRIGNHPFFFFFLLFSSIYGLDCATERSLYSGFEGNSEALDLGAYLTSPSSQAMKLSVMASQTSSLSLSHGWPNFERASAKICRNQQEFRQPLQDVRVCWLAPEPRVSVGQQLEPVTGKWR
ncbi:unnamed protein product [Protopolystoma xenopodis]|uniref:Reelin domain-containing protein n=1 Tax=Protopolystoma xenopodis TaxID=117903 RepID=A0A448XEI9_9PLAT|nr:unnamed protein product [Protopolystoma xenopodis]